jgi:ATP-binding cassette subfamily B protein
MHPLIMMTQLSNTWANGFASAKRINEVLDSEPDVREPENPALLPEPAAGEIRFDSVNFHYDGDGESPAQSALEDICLRIEPGKTLAVLGATGSGKSTLIDLIPRFYDAVDGSVSVDGVDVKKLGQDSLLKHIAIVPQETILFSGTVKDNIRYGRPDAGEDEVVAAAKAAQAHDFIMGLAKGYDTHIEERGGNLSGGQKQRVAIARALIQKPAILILDDSTSSVDVETETKIQDAIGKTMRGTTCVVVAQRISTVLNADKIIVLDQGRIVAEGTHRQLLRSSPVYREIYDSQLGGGFHE